MKYIIRDTSRLSKVIGELRQLFTEHGFLSLTVSTDKLRSLNQNAISHAWYEQVADELREQTAIEVKRECKLNYGVPILRAESDEFRAYYDDLIKLRYTYEEKLRMMDYMPITSLMSTDQLNQYLDAMQKAYAGRVLLEFPR
jgi:hypothetical protein